MKVQVVAMLLLYSPAAAGQDKGEIPVVNDCTGIISRLNELKQPKKHARADTAALYSLLAGTSAEKQAERILLGIALDICKLENSQPRPANYSAKKSCLTENEKMMRQAMVEIRAESISGAGPAARMRLQRKQRELLFKHMKLLKRCS